MAIMELSPRGFPKGAECDAIPDSLRSTDRGEGFSLMFAGICLRPCPCVVLLILVPIAYVDYDVLVVVGGLITIITFLTVHT